MGELVTLRTKLTLATGFLLVMLCGLGVFSLTQMSRINDVAVEIIDGWFPSTRYAMRLDTLVSDFRIAEIRHIYTTEQDVMAGYEKQMNELLTAIEDAETKYAALLDTDAERRLWEKFEGEWKEYMEMHAQIQKLSRDEQTEKAIDILNTTSKELYHKTSESLGAIVDFNVEGSKKTNDSGDKVFNDSRSMVIGMLIAVLLISVVLMAFIIRNTLRQLGKDPGELNAIAHRVVDGDYNIDDGGAKMGVYGAIVEAEGRGRGRSGGKGRAQHRAGPPDVPGTQGGYGPAQRTCPGHHPDHECNLGHRGPDQPPGPQRRY